MARTAAANAHPNARPLVCSPACSLARGSAGFYNETTQTLYYWHNATAGVPPPADGALVAAQTKYFFNITGTMAAPVTDISIVGIGMRDT